MLRCYFRGCHGLVKADRWPNIRAHLQEEDKYVEEVRSSEQHARISAPQPIDSFLFPKCPSLDKTST